MRLEIPLRRVNAGLQGHGGRGAVDPGPQNDDNVRWLGRLVPVSGPDDPDLHRRQAQNQRRQSYLGDPQQNLPPPVAAAQPAQAQQHQTDQRQSPAQLSGKAHPRQALKPQTQQAEHQRQRRRQSFGAFPLKKRMLIHIVYSQILSPRRSPAGERPCGTVYVRPRLSPSPWDRPPRR